MKNIINLTVVTLGLVYSNTSLANEISLSFLKKEIEIAHTQYLKGSAESGLYALEALARILESDNSASSQSEVGANNLSFTYLRIGLLHEKLGNQPKASKYFNKALSSYRGEEIEIARLKEVVVHLDKKHN